MPHAKRTQSPVSVAGRQKPSLWGRATPAAELRVYRWFRKGNRVVAALGTVTSGVFAIEGYSTGFTFSVVLTVLLLPSGLLVELSLRPRRGNKPVGVRQAALDRKAAALSAKFFLRGSAHPRRISYVASADASPRPFAVNADVVYERACVQIRWDGNALIVVGGRGGRPVWSVSSGGVESDFLPPAMGSPKSVTTAPLADVPVVVALALLKPASRPIDLLLFLDSRSRQVGAVHVRGFTEAAISDVARKAGVELGVYELPARLGRSREAVATAMFPRSVLYR